jgi:hypothetical protein
MEIERMRFMTAHINHHLEDGGSLASTERIVPDATALSSLALSAVLPYWDSLVNEIDYLCRVGHPAMDRAESAVFLADLVQQVDDLHRDLVRRARHERTLSEPVVAGSDYGRQALLADLIRARLDLPTFIARHIGLTPVGFRRVGDLLVCPCPLPDDTAEDAWLYVDPVAQTWRCTGCGAGGDVFDFTHLYYGLQAEALRAFLGREAGLTFTPRPTDG